MYHKIFSIIMASSLVVPLRSSQNADIVQAMASLLRSQCVTFVVDHSQEVTVTRVQKALLGSGIHFTSLHSYDSKVRLHTCKQNRPLHVVYSGKILREHLQNVTKVPSFPRWLLFLLPNENAEHILGSLDIPFDCEMFVVSSQDGHHVEVCEMYRIHARAQLTTAHFGHWTPGGGLVVTRDSLYRRRTQLQGHVITAATHDRVPFISMRKLGGGSFKVGGFYGELWKILENLLNFTTHWVVGPGDYGTLTAQGTWNGMVGQVVRGEVQVAVADFTLTRTRIGVVDFCTSVVSSSHRLFIREQRAEAVKWFGPSQPLSTRLWLAVLTSCLLCSLVLAVTALHVRGNVHVGDALFAVFGLFCMQGCELTVVGVPGRTAILTACVTAVVTSTVYSSSLTSSLTDRKVALPFETLQGLADHGLYKLGFLSESAYDLFLNASDPLFSSLASKFFHHDGDRLPLYDLKSLQRVCSEDFAYIASRKYNFEYNNEIWRPCPLTWLPQRVMIDTTSLIVTRHSPYRRLIDYKLRMLHDLGVIKQLRLRHWPKAAQSDAQKFMFVGPAQIAPALALLCAGFALATAVLCCELNTARTPNRN